MGFGTLAIIAAAGLIGPLLALRSGWNIPIVLGELVAGMVLGRHRLRLAGRRRSDVQLSGRHRLRAGDVRRRFACPGPGSAICARVRARARRGRSPSGWSRRSCGSGAAALFDTGNAALYAVLMASSSAALILPIVDSLQLTGPAVLQLLPQVAIADAACIVALPLVIDPAQRRPGRARRRAR